MVEHIAFVDVETTGLDPSKHEIIELAAVRVDFKTLEKISYTSLKVKPERLEDAEPRALEINGYNDAEWKDAVGLAAALSEAHYTFEGAMLAGHNVFFDWKFLNAAWERYPEARPKMDYHLLDTASLMFLFWSGGNISGVSLDKACDFLDIKRERKHRALDDALASLEVARKVGKRHGWQG